MYFLIVALSFGCSAIGSVAPPIRSNAIWGLFEPTKPSAIAEHAESIGTSAVSAHFTTTEPIATEIANATTHKHLRIVTMNTWHGGEHLNNGSDRIAEHMHRLNADVFFLQEVNAEPFRRLMNGSKWSGRINLKHAGAKPALVTRHKIVPGTMFRTKWAFGLTVRLDFGFELNVVNVHLNYTDLGPDLVHGAKNVSALSKRKILATAFVPNGRFQNIKELSEHRCFKKFLAQASAAEVPLVLAGDLNEPSLWDWTSETSHLHKNFVVEWPVTKFLSKKLGLIDSFRQTHPNVTARPGYTWPFRPNQPIGPSDRIDFIFFKYGHQQKQLKPIRSFVYAGTGRLGKAHFADDEPDWSSDHLAVVTDFVLTVPKKKNPEKPIDKTPKKQKKTHGTNKKDDKKKN